MSNQGDPDKLEIHDPPQESDILFFFLFYFNLLHGEEVIRRHLYYLWPKILDLLTNYGMDVGHFRRDKEVVKSAVDVLQRKKFIFITERATLHKTFLIRMSTLRARLLISAANQDVVHAVQAIAPEAAGIYRQRVLKKSQGEED